MKSDKWRGDKDDHFVLCNHCLPITVCYIFPMPESGFDREKREKGKNITIWPIFDGKRKKSKKNRNKNQIVMPFLKKTAKL
jgi:hypothetical protein